MMVCWWAALRAAPDGHPPLPPGDPVVEGIGPDPALLHALAQSLVALRPIENPDWCVVGMQQVTGHYIRLDPLDQRSQNLHGATAPVDQGAVRDVGTHPKKISCWRYKGRWSSNLD